MITIIVLLSALYWLCLGLLALRAYFGVKTIASLPAATRTSWPKLSIVIPARNEGAHVLEALKAKLSDGYPELEVVLVDDRSTDDTGAQARALNDPRLTVARVDTLP
jgi:cellulose synthase/poly-beta-1,6-N-acetylglucosamine synthase-like glycosyltransferase